MSNFLPTVVGNTLPEAIGPEVFLLCPEDFDFQHPGLSGLQLGVTNEVFYDEGLKVKLLHLSPEQWNLFTSVAPVPAVAVFGLDPDEVAEAHSLALPDEAPLDAVVRAAWACIKKNGLLVSGYLTNTASGLRRLTQ